MIKQYIRFFINLVKFIITLIPLVFMFALSPAIRAGLPNPGVQFEQSKTDLLVTDPKIVYKDDKN